MYTAVYSIRIVTPILIRYTIFANIKKRILPVRRIQLKIA